MRHLASACEAIAGTPKKLHKIAIVADYLKSRTPREAEISAIFLSGRPFPVWEEATLQVGGSLLWRLLGELGGLPTRRCDCSILWASCWRAQLSLRRKG